MVIFPITKSKKVINMAQQKRKRASVKENPFVGQHRYTLYKQAIGQFNRAIEYGFYLEAITICESMISDRLESRCTELNKPQGFQTLGRLIKTLKGIETDKILRNTILEDLDTWRLNRNTALHEIVKFEKGDFPNWENKVETSKKYAEEGMIIFRKIDSRISKVRRENA